MPITKEPLNQSKPLENGIPILFTATFTAPDETMRYATFTLIDTLHPSLTFDRANSKIIAMPDIEINFLWQDMDNTITILFFNSDLTAGKEIVVTIATTLTDITKVPSSLRIENSITLIINSDEATKSHSNIVVVNFITCESQRKQAINDLIESVALEQTALSHILNAEGEKIQKMLTISEITPMMLVKTNKSVEDMVRAITQLEMVLQSKLKLFDDCLCVDCLWDDDSSPTQHNLTEDMV